MAVPNKYWKYFLTQTATGLCYYIDLMGNLQTGNILATGKDYSLPEDPDGWEDIELSYVRNSTYWGINRSFTIPLNFLGDGARIIRNLFYLGRGIEQPITLIICKWDESYGAFMPYYKGQLDLTQLIHTAAEGVTVNIMEGGILQLLKSYENTVVEIPCDGSIPQNIKFLADGIKFNDVFHYQIVKLSSPYAGDQPLPLTYLTNDGDNIGVIHGDQNLDQTYDNYNQKSSNFLFSSTSTPVTVHIQGSISVKSDPSIHNTAFYMYAATSLSAPKGIGDFDHAVGLVTPQNPQPGDVNDYFVPRLSTVIIDGQRSFQFDEIINLEANENLFIFFFNDFADKPIQILGGSVSLAFSSRLAPSRVWGIPLIDVWKILGQKLNQLASTTDYPFNFLFTSNLLEKFRRIVLTSGDAIRASTDPDYFQYYNLATLNPQNPNNTVYNQYSSLGPVIKVKLSDIFGFINPVKCASLGNQPDENGNDSIFIEDRAYVLNKSTVTLALPQVTNFRISPDTDKYFNWLQIGYQANDYDESSGKYEYNNTTSFQAPIKSMAKVLQLVSSNIRTDSYGFEFKRYNTQGGKSSTFNESDNSLWAVSIDYTQSSPDYYEGYYSSGIRDTTTTANTNILYLKGMNYQPLILGTLDGEYFVDNIDFSIFMFNQPAPGSKTIAITFTALLNGLPGDNAVIKFYYNGTLMQTWSQAVAGVNTAFNGAFNITVNAVLGDNMYFTVDTFNTCTISVNQFSLNVGSGYFICQLSGPASYPAGSTEQLLSLPLITAQTVNADGNTIQVVSYGFQNFRFLSNVQDTNFNMSAIISAYIQGNTDEFATFNLWRNGVKIGEIAYHGTNVQTTINLAQTPQFSAPVTETNYDMYWMTVSCTNVNFWIYYAQLKFESDAIKAFLLLRETYDSVIGVPNPETAFNIIDYTPMRMLQANGPMLRSILYMIGSGSLTFQTADKNQFLSTRQKGTTITENASVDIHSLGDPLWLPLIFDFDTQIPYTAKQIFDASENGYISFQWKGKTYYGFPLEVKIKPALNDSQSWKLLASTDNQLTDLVELDWDGLVTLLLMDSYIPYINPVHFVPLNFQKAEQYNSYTMDETWLVNRIRAYADKNNYYAPWQLNDTITLQCQSGGLSPAVVTILNEKGQPTGLTYNCTQVVTSAVLAPQLVYQVSIPLSALLAEGKYYLQWSIGTGAATAQWISEGIWIKKHWPKTQLYQYKHSRNKLGVIFNGSTPFNPTLRMFSQINKFTPKGVYKTFVNEPQDIYMQNAIPYDTWNLDMGFGSGMPDYMVRKMDRIMYLDTVFIDGNQYSRDADAEMDVTYIDGQPKAYAKLAIRKAINADGTTINTAGQIEGPQQAGYVIDAQAFGNDDGEENLIEVSNS